MIQFLVRTFYFSLLINTGAILSSQLIASPGDAYFMERWSEVESKLEPVDKEIKETLYRSKDIKAQNYLERAENLLLEKGRESEVIMLCNKSLEIEESYIAYFMRAYAKNGIGLDKQAISDLNKAIIINNNRAAAYNNRGVSYSNIGNNRKAISDFNKAINLDKELAIAYHNIFIPKYNLGYKKSACDDIKKAAYLGSKISLEWIESDNGKWCRNSR